VERVVLPNRRAAILPHGDLVGAHVGECDVRLHEALLEHDVVVRVGRDIEVVVRAQDLGLALAMVPLVLVVMNVVYTAVAYPAGVAADRGYRKALLVWGLLALIGADLLLAQSASLGLFFAALVLWGLHMGLTQGLLSTLVADAAPEQLRGTAFGVFHCASGAALLAASVIAGWLWQTQGAQWTFYAAATFSAFALVGLLSVRAKAATE